MLLEEAVDKFIETLRPLYIDESQFYDLIPSRRHNEPPAEVLNIHGVRLFASIAGIGIEEDSTKVLVEPDLEDPKSEIVVCSYASWDQYYDTRDGGVSKGRGYYAEISQGTHFPPKKDSGPRVNPNFRETAISRAARNAMLGLIPSRYLILKIKQLTIEKNEMRSDLDKINQARIAARERASVLEQEGISSSIIFEEVKSIRDSNIEDWGVDDWNFLKFKFEEAIGKQVSSDPVEEDIDQQADDSPEVEITSEDITDEELADVVEEDF